jgi:lysozyme
MNLNQAGIELIKNAEGCCLDSYPDPGTGDKPWTIGWGSTGPDIGPDMRWSQQECDARLVKDLNDTADHVRSLLKATISDNKFSALVSFAYNVGVHNLAGSSLLRLINAGNSSLAANEFIKWNHAAGKVLPGLTKRREAEKELFLA